MKKVLFSVAATTLLVLSFGLSKASPANPSASDQNSSSDNSEVKIDNFSFTPSTVTVAVGTTVTWVNHDDVPHNVVS